MSGLIRIVVAESSLRDRDGLVATLRGDPGFAVVGEASRSTEVLALARRLVPDILVVGVDLPTAGGFEITREIMSETPTPVVIVSDEGDPRQVEQSILALRAGALAVVPRLAGLMPPGRQAAGARLIATVRAMAGVKVVRHWPVAPSSPRPALPAAARPQPRIIAIAASTGGPAALQVLLSGLPATFPTPILVVQHIGKGFVDGLVTWLNTVSSLKVRVAAAGEPILSHTVYVAPDDAHLGVLDRGRIALSRSEPIGGFRPSATFLFEQVGRVYGPAATHVILTGMGQDGVAGLKVAAASGGRVIAQDEASSIVYGMPGAAVAAGIVDQVLPLAAIGSELLQITENAREGR